MIKMRIRPELLLVRETQFCSICKGQGKGWVRVANIADMVELRKGRNEVAARRLYVARRKAATVRHFKAEHPELVS